MNHRWIFLFHYLSNELAEFHYLFAMFLYHHIIFHELVHCDSCLQKLDIMVKLQSRPPVFSWYFCISITSTIGV